MPITEERSLVKPTLGQYLESIRKDRRMTLRKVEEATSKEISNAYLSQLEQGKIQQPSPNILHVLSEIYAIDYAKLMELAGYITPSSKTSGDEERHGSVATFAEHNLTAAEQAELLDYLDHIRSRKRRHDEK